MFDFYFILFVIILFVSSIIFEEKHEKGLQQKEALEIKKREETDIAFRHRDIPDVLLADEYLLAEYNNDTNYMEDLKKVMMERSKKASFEEAYDYYYKIYDEWRLATNYGVF